MSYASHPHSESALPIGNGLIAGSIMVALLLNMLPWSGWMLLLRPDFVAITILYWSLHTPNRIGMGWAWLVGILVDVSDTSLLGQHALSYVILAFYANTFQRRIGIYSLSQQLPLVSWMLLLSYTLYILIHWLTSQDMAWVYFISCITSILCWVPLSIGIHTVQSYIANRSSHD